VHRPACRPRPLSNEGTGQQRIGNESYPTCKPWRRSSRTRRKSGHANLGKTTDVTTQRVLPMSLIVGTTTGGTAEGGTGKSSLKHGGGAKLVKRAHVGARWQLAVGRQLRRRPLIAGPPGPRLRLVGRSRQARCPPRWRAERLHNGGKDMVAANCTYRKVTCFDHLHQATAWVLALVCLRCRTRPWVSL